MALIFVVVWVLEYANPSTFLRGSQIFFDRVMEETSCETRYWYAPAVVFPWSFVGWYDVIPSGSRGGSYRRLTGILGEPVWGQGSWMYASNAWEQQVQRLPRCSGELFLWHLCVWVGFLLVQNFRVEWSSIQCLTEDTVCMTTAFTLQYL